MEAQFTYIGRSLTTGKLHWAHGKSVTSCSHSGQHRRSLNRVASAREITEAATERFCKKCFPSGKPSAAEIAL